MIFNLATIVLAASALVCASPSLSKRGETSCVISMSGFPFPVTDPLPSGASVTAEWTIYIEQLFAESATPVRVSAATVDGPAGENIYTISTTVGSPSVTDAEAATIVKGWAGRTVFGVPPSNMRWQINAASCS
ncbi:hypothetical protein FA13DRAFT_1731696 [Coprinellus micaceus]|uniref:Uncharacterized protein n=1 Tax=Coprinellus micaceus TaxID=71717 RepID=A0A4Y7TG02_COPMI|nr:hypothetical protein FA13DRAFT_1731696 [Coprinellus micaceus]